MINATGTTGYRTETCEKPISRPKPITWARILVDIMLLAAMLVVSSKLFAP